MLKVIGAPGSPYSRKMRAVLRFRRIPYCWITRGGPDDPGGWDVPVALIPIVAFPDGETLIDSTPVIRRLEEEHTARRIVPEDRALAFLDFLIEDFADEWLTKAMFHYRWAYEADIAKASAVLPRWGQTAAPEAETAPLSKYIAERQIGRMALVGCNPVTAPVIEESYRRLLRALDALLQKGRFIMGSRPGACDFGVYGQLSQLVLFDPTPAAAALEESPRVVAWCENMEDLSGVEWQGEGWLSREAAVENLRELLGLGGEYYAPFLLANAAALAAGEKEVSCEISGKPWRQGSFPYQGKCLTRLREFYGSLDGSERALADAALKGSGCERLFA